MFEFHYQYGNARRKLHRVTGSVCSIGSARSNDLVVETRMVGKRHAELRLQADGVHIRDLGSLGGCWVNRERVLEHGPLSDLDEIAVGDISVAIHGVPTSGEEGGEGMRSVDPHLPSRSAETRADTFSESAGRSVLRAFGFGSSRRESGAAGGSGKAEVHGASGADGTHGEAGANGNGSVERSREGRSVRTDVAAEMEDEDRSSSAAGERGEPSGHGARAPTTPGAEATAAPAGVPVVDSDAGLGAEPAADPRADEQLAYWGGIVHEQLLYQMDLRRKDVNRMSDAELRAESIELIGGIIAALENQLPDTLDRGELERNVLNESVGLGPLEQFLEDDEVTEIMVNNHREIFVEKQGRLERSRFRFSSDRTVHAVIERIITPLGRRIDESSPIVDARLKDGSRVNAIIPPLALKGPSLTIRKFPKHRLVFEDLVAYGSVDANMVEFLRVCVEMRKNIVVSGGTGSGKTTLLNVLSNFIPDSDRIVTIEDAAELKLAQPNLVSLESRPPNLEGKGAVPIRDLVRNSLRMRPDRIVVGECRGGEALDMLQAMNTGHDGSLTTVHANNPRDVISRLEVLVLMAGMELPVSAIREQVASAVHLILQQSRFPCGSRKITRITEVVGVESGTVQLQDIFTFDQDGVDERGRVRGRFRATGAIPTFYEELRRMGVAVDLECFDMAGSRVA